MPEIIFKKRRGTVVDLFNVLCMYSISPSLNAILKSYRIKVDPYLYYSYDKICQFIDENVKNLKPFFAKRDGSVLDGSIFHKMTQMILAREDLLMFDVIDYFKRMKPEYFLAEMFRIMDDKPETERKTYLKIVKDRDLTKEFLNRQNCTAREKKAILIFQKEIDFEYECLVDFIEKLYKKIELEHSRNREQIMRYTDWLQYRLNPKHPEFIFNNPGILLEPVEHYDRIIVTVSLFPPCSCNAVNCGNGAVVSFGVGAFMPYAQRCYKRQINMRDKPCEMRENVFKVLVYGPMRLIDIANKLNTSSPDLNYHIGILVKNGFVKRVRGNGPELFALTDDGYAFINKSEIAVDDASTISNG